jgi:hypothetical protein
MGSADSPTFNPMTNPELAAAMVAAYDDRYDRTGPLEDPVAPCLAAALRVMVEQVVPEDLRECANFTNEAIRLNLQYVRQKHLAIAAELEAL